MQETSDTQTLCITFSDITNTTFVAKSDGIRWLDLKMSIYYLILLLLYSVSQNKGSQN